LELGISSFWLLLPLEREELLGLAAVREVDMDLLPAALLPDVLDWLPVRDLDWVLVAILFGV
jgi:hypothetical protein